MSETVLCRGREIAVIREEEDGSYKFDREALEDKNGGISLSQLRDDEFVVAPGAIYRKIK